MRPCLWLAALLLLCCGAVGVYRGISDRDVYSFGDEKKHEMEFSFQNIEFRDLAEGNNEVEKYRLENMLYKMLKPSYKKYDENGESLYGDVKTAASEDTKAVPTDENDFTEAVQHFIKAADNNDVTTSVGDDVTTQARDDVTTADYDEEIEVRDGDIGDIPDPPDHKETARMSRYLCHYSDWLAMATISTRGALSGTPFASIFSFSDGPMDKSTGIPYFYMTNMDMSTHDLQKNPKASVTISLAQSGYCSSHKLDPEDPRCAHVILAGEVVKVQTNSTEEAFAKQALFSRHPVMPDWPEDHGWYFAKLDITSVILLDFFGGAIDVPLKEYYSVKL